MEYYSYDFINLYNARITPSTVHCGNDRLTNFFRRYLFQKCTSVFEWDLPESWDQSYFLAVLYGLGYVVTFRTEGVDAALGVIPQNATPNARNVYYQPVGMNVSNPALKEKYWGMEIGTECAVIKLTPDYCGILDIVHYYAEQMALCAEAFGVNNVNSKFAYMFFAKNKAAAETIKKAYDQVQEGNPMVVLDAKMLDDDGNLSYSPVFNNLKQQMIGKELLDNLYSLSNAFDAEIGIKNMGGIEKKERMLSDEVNSNNESTYSKAKLWYDELQRGIQMHNTMFPEYPVSVRWRFNDTESNDAEVNEDERMA